MPRSSTPADRRTQATTGPAMWSSANLTTSTPHGTLSRLYHAACTLSVYASQPGSPPDHATLDSGWWPALTGQGSHLLGRVEGFRHVYPSTWLSPSPSFAWRNKGLSKRRVIWRHMFGNVLVQLITVIGLTYASLLEGSVLTEIIFSWPGIGQYITHSLFNGDMNAVVGGTVIVGMCFVCINLIPMVA